MSSDVHDRDTPGAHGNDLDDLAAEVELLAEENERLRREYSRARRTRYRRTALALATVGLVAIAAGAAFPGSRTVLVAIGSTGVFGGLLTYYLTPERFLPAAVGERVFEASAQNWSAIAAELGLADDRVYVPVEGVSGPGRPVVRLYIPQHAEYELPDDESLSSTFVAVEHERARGVSMHPTGAPLFREFDRAFAGDLADTPGPLARQLADGIVEQFELARSATTDVDPEVGRLTIGIRDSAYGAIDRFDHPVASFVAVGTATALGTPVTVVTSTGDDRADFLVTCTWPESDAVD